MDYKKRQEILERVIKEYGIENQVRKAIEELTELSLELQRHIANPWENDIQVVQELADVQIMTDQLRIIFTQDKPLMYDNLETMKLERQERRLEGMVCAQCVT